MQKLKKKQKEASEFRGYVGFHTSFFQRFFFTPNLTFLIWDFFQRCFFLAGV